MAENDQTGIAPAAQPAQPVTAMTAQATEQAPPATQQTQAPPQAAGKTVEQLAAELDEQNAQIREAQDQLARMAHERELERQMYANLTAGRPKPQEPEAPAVTDDEFLANPAKATAKMLDGYMAREKAERDREKASQYIETARRSHETGWNAAVKENPGLFKGIEASVRSEILANVRDSFQAGKPVDADILENPRYYQAAAVAMRIMNGDDPSKFFAPRQTQPMAPVYTETPSAGNPPQAGITLTPQQEEVIAKGGIKREQFIESLNKIRNADAERKR